MEILRNLRVKNFRSLKNIEIKDLDNFNVLMGANNSGKSNVLRALNLFFNGEIEPYEELDINRDCSAPKKKKKEIIISVDFELPALFKFRKELRDTENYLGRSFTVEKRWTLNASEPEIFFKRNNDSNLEHLISYENKNRIYHFLGLIQFRYIPSHRDPTELLLKEQDQLRQLLMNRLEWRLSRMGLGKKSRGRKNLGVIFETLEKTGKQALKSVINDLYEMSPEIESVDLTLPEDIEDLILSLNYEVRLKDDTTVLSRLQGSGVQTYVLFRILNLIDSTLPQQSFGWKQAIIWVIEEPESFLHRNLEIQVASDLSEMSNVEGNRFQIIASTHSEDVVQYSDKQYFLALVGTHTKIESMELNELLDKIFSEGVSSYLHPVLTYPMDPIILFEGKYDIIIMRAAYDALNEIPPGRLISLEHFDKSRTGGDDILRYLKSYPLLIKNRPEYAPIVVVWDWGKEDKRNKTDRLLRGIHPNSFSIRFDPSEANENLDDSFHGIERYLSTRIIEIASEKGLIDIVTPRNAEFPFGIRNRNKFNSNKGEIAKLVMGKGIADDFEYLEGIIQRLKEGLKGIRREYPLFSNK